MGTRRYETNECWRGKRAKNYKDTQFKNLKQLRQRYDKLVEMASKELIEDDTFKEKTEELLSHIKEAESDVADTNNRSEKWCVSPSQYNEHTVLS